MSKRPYLKNIAYLTLFTLAVALTIYAICCLTTGTLSGPIVDFKDRPRISVLSIYLENSSIISFAKNVGSNNVQLYALLLKDENGNVKLATPPLASNSENVPCQGVYLNGTRASDSEELNYELKPEDSVKLKIMFAKEDLGKLGKSEYMTLITVDGWSYVSPVLSIP